MVEATQDKIHLQKAPIKRTRPKIATLTRRGKIFYISWYDPSSGKRRIESAKTSNRKLAEAMCRKRDAAMVMNTTELESRIREAVLDPMRAARVMEAISKDPLPQVTVETGLSEYFSHASTYKKDSTLRKDRNRVRYFFSKVNITFISELTPDVVQDFFDKKINGEYMRSIKKAGSSVEVMEREPPVKVMTNLRTWEILHAICAYWIKPRKYLTSNPIEEVAYPKPTLEEVVILEDKDIITVLATLHGDMLEAPYASALFGGFREEEVTYLQWPDIDFDAQGVRVTGRLGWTPKTKGSVRTIEMSPALKKYLLDQRKKTMRNPKQAKSPWVFSTPNGEKWKTDSMAQRLIRRLRRAGLQSPTGTPWNFLQARHTFGSGMARQGASLLEISKQMGNSESVAEKHYVRFMKGSARMKGLVNFFNGSKRPASKRAHH